MNPMDPEWLALLVPPLLAGLIVLATHVPLGAQVLRRGIIFIDLAVAQLAGLGVILVHAVLASPPGWAVQVAAFAAALGGALGLRWAEQHWARDLEAVIGVVFVLAVSLALLLLAQDPQGGERLQELLAGQLLWVTYDDLWLPALVSAMVLFVWFRAGLSASATGFYALFAVSVTLSVQLVGVYLVFASLIIPALASRGDRGHTAAFLLGGTAYLLGLLGSAATDLPTGPLVVCTMVLLGLLRVLATRGGGRQSE